MNKPAPCFLVNKIHPADQAIITSSAHVYMERGMNETDAYAKATQDVIDVLENQRARIEREAVDAYAKEYPDAAKRILDGKRGEVSESISEPESEPIAEPIKQELSAEEKAKQDLDDALSDIGDIFGKNFRASITPEQEQKLMPVLTRLFDAAFRLGYHKFKAAAKFALDTLRAKFGDEVADAITLDHLQGSYIGMAGRYKEQGADSKKDVVAYDSIKELLADPKADIAAAAHEAASSPLNDKPAPTKAQAEAGSYAKGHITLHGLDISIENPEGSQRSNLDTEEIASKYRAYSGTKNGDVYSDANTLARRGDFAGAIAVLNGSGIPDAMKISDQAWSSTMPPGVHYGYIKRTLGADGDHVDVFVGPNPEYKKAWIINQRQPMDDAEPNDPNAVFDEHKVMLGFKSGGEAVAAYLLSFEGKFGAKVFQSVSPSMSIDELKAQLPKLKKARNVKAGETPAFLAPTIQSTEKKDGFVKLGMSSDGYEIWADAAGRRQRRKDGLVSGEILRAGGEDQAPIDPRYQVAEEQPETKPAEFKQGDRVVIAGTMSPEMNGRHGEIVGIDRYVMQNLFGGGREERAIYRVKTDGGVVHSVGNLDDLSHETETAEFVADPLVDGSPMLPSILFNGMAYTRKNIAANIERAQRARTDAKKAEWKREAARLQDKLATHQAAWNEWAGKNPGKAAEIMGETPAAVAPQPSTAPESKKLIRSTRYRQDYVSGQPVIWDTVENHVANDVPPGPADVIADRMNGMEPLMYVTDSPEIGYLTKKGKLLAGVIAKDLTEDEAKSVDKYTWKKDGGYFIRMNHVKRPTDITTQEPNNELSQSPRTETIDNRPDRGDGGSSQPDRGSLGGGASEANPAPGSGRPADPGAQAATGAGEPGGGTDAPVPVGGQGGMPANAGDRPERPAAPVAIPSEPKVDHVIGDEAQIDQGGQKTRARRNIAAIRLAKQITEEGRRATVAEQGVLAKYIGWGGIKPMFDEGNKAWTGLRDELKALLTATEYAAARASVLNAHYTGVDTVAGMWSAAKRLGFTSGRVLEPSVGVGNFFGAMPAAMRQASTLYGVELDNITGMIAKLLYPNATIMAPIGFESAVIPAGAFDFATGNPPFGKDNLFDPNNRDLRALSIHNFFFMKSLRALRPGGILQMVVSRYLMDGNDYQGNLAKEMIGANARFLGAIRLPYTAFLENANTEVVADIIFLQKLAPGETAETDWATVADVETTHPKTGEKFIYPISRYFIDHPEMVLGTHSPTGKMMAANTYTVEPNTGTSLIEQLGAAIENLPENVYQPSTTPMVELHSADALVPDGVRVYGYFVSNGKIMQRLPDNMGVSRSTEAKLKESDQARVIGMIGVRDALRDLMRAELTEDVGENEIERLRARLNTVYDAFQGEFGYMNDDANRRAFNGDPDLPRLESLEPGYAKAKREWQGKMKTVKHKDGTTSEQKVTVEVAPKTAKKADIFSKRVLSPSIEPTNADSATDALMASLNVNGRIDPDYMADLYGKPWSEIEAELGSLIFMNPSGGYETADAYLSGNVKAKLKQAIEAVRTDKRYQANVEALTAVQPPDVPPFKIFVRLGSPWLPPAVIERFAIDTWKSNTPRAAYIRSAAKWIYNGSGGDPIQLHTVWGTPRMSADEILLHALNGKQIIITDPNPDRDKPPIINEAATEAARAKGQEMAAKFKDWVWQTPERRTELARIYNENYNTDRRRSDNGDHLTLPGSSPAITLRQHQKAGIWRAVQDRIMLLDKVVGSGKTYEMTGIAKEMRRLGIARKPMFVVPNSLVRQWRDDFYKLYPNANILAATEADFEKKNRRRFAAKIATGDWDAVIVAHSSFARIAMPVDAESEIIQEQIDEIADAIEAMKRERGDKRIVSTMEQLRKKLKARMDALKARVNKDDTIGFDELGVDGLFVDEAHCFPADTKVLTNAGHVAISEIVENRLPVNVLSVDSSTGVLEWKQVTGWFKNAVTHYPVRVHHAGGVFECTANHKVWTDEEGYVEAGRLAERHTITLAPNQMAGTEASREDMHAMRSGIQVQVIREGEQRQEAVLLEPVRGDVEDGAATHQGEDNAWSAGRTEEVGSQQGWHNKTRIIGTDEGQQPDAQSGIGGENAALVERAHIPGARRKWENDAAAVGGEQGTWVANGVCDSDGARVRPVYEPAEALQGGLGAPGVDDGDRNRREDAQDKTLEISGQAENGSAERARVVRVEVLERGSDGQFPDGFRADQSVYCLEVEDNHNFFADGVLVSNSYKNLFYTSSMRNIGGLGTPSGSGRAFDLFVKVRYLTKRHAGKAAMIFATGTPVSNSLVEMYTMQRYLSWDKLKDAGLHLLDAWAGVYADIQNVYEVHPSGTGYRMATRFAKYVNLPQLMTAYRGFADVVSMKDLQEQAIARGTVFPIPKIKGGRPRNIVAERSKLQTEFFGVPVFQRDDKGDIVFKLNGAPQDYSVETDEKTGKHYIAGTDKRYDVHGKKFETREEAIETMHRLIQEPVVGWNDGSILWSFEHLKELTKNSKGKINALSITNKARKAGLDYRLIDPSAPDFAGSKLNIAVDEIMRIHGKWSADKGTQLVFCDLSVPISERARAATTERHAFVRDSEGGLRRVNATVTSVKDVDRAFLVVHHKGESAQDSGYSIYDGLTGVHTGIAEHEKKAAVAELKSRIENDGLDWLERLAGDTQPIEDSEIADWMDANEAEEDEDNAAINADELTSLAGSGAFSVYDDIKAKLIAKGIPEKEIAFIHDYATAVKKADLFRRVREGEIRVLLGSTQKMGAGMNVQDRLVALHHLDAPWRPSDLEQREGRIVRQGNLLYQRDPDGFEAEILRYSTKQTYDTRMWQIIEHKAAGVEQMRSAGEDVLELSEDLGEAANASDMKAAASGNPMILDEIRLRNEVKSLEMQQYAHNQTRAMIQDKIAALPGQERYHLEELGKLESVVALRDANPAKPFKYTYGKKEFDKIDEATHPLSVLYTDAVKDEMGNKTNAGEYRGFKIEFKRGVGVVYLHILGADQYIRVSTYTTDDKFSPSGMFTRIDNELSDFDREISREKRRFAERKEEVEGLREGADTPFPKEEELAGVRARHRAIVNQLSKAGGSVELSPAMRQELTLALVQRQIAGASGAKFSTAPAVANPHSENSLSTAMKQAFSPKFVDALLGTGNVEIVTMAQAKNLLRPGALSSVSAANAVYEVISPDGKYLGKRELSDQQARDMRNKGYELRYDGTRAHAAMFSRNAQPQTEFRSDIPNEDWLQEQIDYAKSRGMDTHGVPYMGKVTGYFRGGNPEVSVDRLATIKGEKGEQENRREDDLAWLINEMRQNGLKNVGAPYIEVGYDGVPWVSEGNHRIMAAKELGWETMPIEIRYFDGGERIPGNMSPDSIYGSAAFSQDQGTPQAFYLNGKTYLIADAIDQSVTSQELRALLRHEIGVHAMHLGRDDAEFKAILNTMELMRKAGNQDVIAAYDRATQAEKLPERRDYETDAEHEVALRNVGYPIRADFTKQDDYDAAVKARNVWLDSIRPEEMLAYVIQAQPDSTLAKRFMAWFKRMVNKVLGAAGAHWNYTLEDLNAMAEAALLGYPQTMARGKWAWSMVGELAMGSQSAPMWFSPLNRMVLGAKQDSMPAGQWTLWLQSNKSKFGVKDDELQFSGVLDYLALRGKDKVTKGEIADYLAGNGVVVEDVVKGADQDWAVWNPMEREEYYFSTENEARDYANENDIPSVEVFPKTDRTDSTKFGPGSRQHHWEQSYKGGIPGSYREILVTLPRAGTGIVFDYEQAEDGLWELFNARTGEKVRSYQREGDAEFAAEQANRQEQEKTQFKSGHWQEPNVLVHLRLDEVTGADGKRYVRVGEVQGDWPQAYRKQREAIGKSVDGNFQAIVDRMKADGVLKVEC